MIISFNNLPNFVHIMSSKIGTNHHFLIIYDDNGCDENNF